MSSFIDGETYLEGFIESLSTIPPELRRNLDLMKDMDVSCSTLMEETRMLQQDYIRRVEDKIGKLEVVDGEGVRVLSNRNNEDNDEDKDSNNNIDINDEDEKMVPCDPVIIPTTEELMAYVHEPTTMSRIQSLRSDALQQAEEKVEVAKQSYKMIDNLYWKLDEIISETKIQATRNGTNFHHPSNSNATTNQSSISSGLSLAGGSGPSSTSRTSGRNRGAPKSNDLAAV